MFPKQRIWRDNKTKKQEKARTFKNYVLKGNNMFWRLVKGAKYISQILKYGDFPWLNMKEH